MLEATGNLWNFEGVHCITTNGFVKNDGISAMGRGCAKEARDKYPSLPAMLGTALNLHGNHVLDWPQFNLITFPVKYVWWNPADLNLIKESSYELMHLINSRYLDDKVYLPRPGCGNGNLDWKDVKPIIAPILSDQVTVITF